MNLWYKANRWLIDTWRGAGLVEAPGDGSTDASVAKDSVEINESKDDYERALSIIDNVDRVVPFLKKGHDD